MRKLYPVFAGVMLLLTLAYLPLSGQINDGGSLPQSMLLPDFPGDSIPAIDLPEVQLERIQREDEVNDQLNFKAPRFGVLIRADIGFEQGHWTELENGDRVWRVKIKAPGAKATNLYFDDFYMPQGATMHVYSPDHSEILGGFGFHNNAAHGMFVTALIHAPESILEYYEPLSVRNQGRIHINEVNHAYRMVHQTTRSPQRDFGDSQDCEVNINCSPEGNGKTEQRDAVARILVKAGDETGWCSGTMINNARNDCKPYFLTALHCADTGTGDIIPQADFNQWIFYFNYQAAGCTNPTNESQVPNNTITGADIRADSEDPNIDTGSDLLLLELQSAVPANYNVYYAGWNRSASATTGGFGIHHPAGDIKKISTFSGTATSVGWNQAGVTHWSVEWVSTANGHGVTEGGSSGSALFDNNGLVIGSLSGGSSFCETPTDEDQYGKMSHHWDQNGNTANRRLKDWLDPDNTGVMTLQGTYFPCQGAGGGDAGIAQINFPANGSNLCDNPFTPSVTLKNFGSDQLTTVTIQYQVNQSGLQSYAWNGSLSTDQTEIVMLPAIAATSGAFTFKAFSTNPNDGMDSQTGNDAAEIMAQYHNSINIPYTVNFANGIPNEMRIVDPDDDALEWMHSPTVNGFGTGTGVGSMIVDNFSNDLEGTMDFAYLPSFDLSVKEGTMLEFDVAYARYNETFFDQLKILVSNDCGQTTEMVYHKSGSQLATAPDDNSDNIFIPTADEWRTEQVDLSMFDGDDHVTICFVNQNGYGQPIYIDNIRVYDQSQPYQILSSGIKYNTLMDAISAATMGETILLIDDAQEGAPITLPVGINFDFQSPFLFIVKTP